MIVLLHAPYDHPDNGIVLRHFATEEVPGDENDPPKTFTWGGRQWRRFYQFGLPKPLCYLDVEANHKSVTEGLARMLKEETTR